MPRSFNTGRFNLRDPKLVMRVLLGVLVAANLAAVGLVLFPPGGSAEQLEQERAALIGQVGARRLSLQQTKQHAQAVDKGRAEGDEFLSEYFLSTRTAFFDGAFGSGRGGEAEPDQAAR